MKQRIITGLLLALVLIPVVIVGNVSFQVAMALIAGVATFELLSICKRFVRSREYNQRCEYKIAYVLQNLF